MEAISFFEEQAHRRRQTSYFVILGLLWMAIMGWLVVGANAPLLTLMKVDEARIREWSIISSLTAIVLWGGVAFVLLHYSGRFLPRLIGGQGGGGRR